MNELPAIAGGRSMFDKLMPIARPDLPPLDEIKPYLEDMFETGMITNHKFVKRFESAIAEYLQVKHAICASSGTSALMLAAKALGLKGDVITPSFTFSATVHALSWCNLNPVFVDIDRETFNIDTSKIEKAITKDTSAIVPVNVFGNPCEIDKLEKISQEFNLKLLFDSAHAFGTAYRNKKVGNFGDAEMFSLTPTKVLTAGEGGIIATNNEDVCKQIILDREYGKMPDYDCKTIGLSARMAEFNAILGFHNLQRLDENIKRRNELYKIYTSELIDIGGLTLQKLNKNAECSMKDFAIVIDNKAFGVNRDKLADALTKENIAWRKYFYPPVHKETAYKNLEISKKALPNTDFISESILTLPFFTAMTDEDVIKICNAIKRINKWAKNR